MWRMLPDGLLEPLLAVAGIAEPFNAPRQALPVVWWQNGYVDAFWLRTVVDQHSLTGSKILGYVMNEPEYVDVDSFHDFRLLEVILQSRRRGRP
jgi:N-acylneuraminate cytidylyltransferase